MPLSSAIPRDPPAIIQVLLVDDDRAACQSIAQLIEQSNLPWHLATADSLAQRREKGAVNGFDVVVLAESGLADGDIDALRHSPNTIWLIEHGNERRAALRRCTGPYLVKDE